MSISSWYALIILSALLALSPVLAAENTVPVAGTVFLGEQGLDISATGAAAGSQIVYYGPGGSPATVPVATMTVDDPTDYYISPALFGGRTGPWFLSPANTLAFYVQDPLIGIRVMDESADFAITSDVTWIPKGDVVGFRIDTNVYEIARRPGSPGAPITIRIRGPGGVEYSSVTGYQLEDILISASPFDTGGVWLTGGFESGTYTVWAESTGNDMNLNYKQEGKTVTVPVQFLLQSTNPLITPTPTTNPATTTTTLPPTLPATTVTTLTPATVITESPATTPGTIIPTTAPPTTTPGFGAMLTLSAFFVACLLFMARHQR